MKCKEFEKDIPDFLSDKLDEYKLPDFVAHVKNCKACEEELAIQYLTTEGLIRLEEGSAFSLDNELSLKINKAGKLVRLRDKIDLICRNIEIVSIIIICLTLILLFI